MPGLHKLLQIILEHSTLFNGMTLLSVICVVRALVPPGWVPSHLTQPMKVRFILYPFQNLVNRLLECHVNPSRTDLRLWDLSFLPRGSFSLTLLSVILQPFMLFNPSHELVHILKGSHSQRISQFKFLGEPQPKRVCYNLLISSIYLIV